ncbi:MAG: amidohydrolase family protein [Clostridia bacterium]|nr:amidohydrolase family protein [Clostridia bacterium]
MVDILIKRGQIVDGSGAPAFFADIAVKDGKIVQIKPDIAASAKKTIDASGLQVAPGFLDSHSHSDASVFTGSDSYNYLEQGVTTQIAGQCGSSPAPYTAGSMEGAEEKLTRQELRERAEKAKTPASFMKAAESAGFGTNMAFFIGQGTLREKVLGYSGAAPDSRQMTIMQQDLKEAMEAGYLGVSSGLVYAPSVYATTEELIELIKIMAPYDGIYASHIRGEGDNVLRSVREAIRIGEECGVPVWISHLKVMGKHNEGISQRLLEEIDRANARGVAVFADQYPYTAGSAPLSSQIPPKYLTGGIPALLKRLKSSVIRRQIEHSIFCEANVFESAIYSAGFGGCLIVEGDKTPQYKNKTIGQIAEEEGKDPMDVLADVLLANDGLAQGIYFNQCASDLLRIMGHPNVFLGSDWSDYGDGRVDPEQPGGGHPRGTASAVRRLELVRDFRLRTMEESVKNLTYDTARALGLVEHGLLREGWDANICVFDYHKLHATADYSHPFRKNQGIYWVLVNGQLAVEEGTALGTRAGKVLKRKKSEKR